MRRCPRACLPVVFGILVLLAAAGTSAVASAAQPESKLISGKNNRTTVLTLSQLKEVQATATSVRNARLIEVADAGPTIALWEEEDAGRVVPYYAVSLDGQRLIALKPTSYDLLLRHARFDPLTNEPLVGQSVAARNGQIYVVQFWTQPLEAYREQLREAGATIYKYVANHAYLVKMRPTVRDRVKALPFVRWVGPYHPAYRLEELLFEELVSSSVAAARTPERRRYNIQVFERGNAQQNAVASRIRALGGTVDATNPLGFRMEATLTPPQVLSVAAMDEILFIDRWTPIGVDMNIVREIGGANFIESTLGFTGNGVRAEIMDLNGTLRQTHVDYQDIPPIFHNAMPGSGGHGNSTYGIIFGTGTGNPAGRGLLPSAQGIFAQALGGLDRYLHTSELLQDPYFAVFQSNSWGNTQTTVYTTISAEMDDLLFTHDILVTQSQSNTGNRNSRPQAWAKNVVSVGGIKHFNTLDMSDDCWGCTPGAASIGPAADGRIKPDLAHFFDLVFTVGGSTDTSYTNFSGTSGATPIVAGHFGIFFQMWHNGLFGNPTGATVFESRPHMTTSKAMLINTAQPWSFSGSTHDLSRDKQGWGMPSLFALNALAMHMRIIDETDVLTNLASSVYSVEVSAEIPEPLRVTLVYKDPAGTTSSQQHRINDLTLKVLSPSGQEYWGNNGLRDGLWSVPGGEPNTIDTVENVFVEAPEAGVWTVEVIASEINEDSHLETPEIDADYALVISGVTNPPPSESSHSTTRPGSDSRKPR